MTALKEIFPEIYPFAKWTVILLINGENDLLEDMKGAYNQLANVGSDIGKVNFVALFDGIPIEEETDVSKSGNKFAHDGVPALYYITRYDYFERAEPLKKYTAEENLTNPDNLLSILRDIKKRFPAENFGFIYKGHGGQNPDINNAIYTTKITSRRIKRNGQIETEEEITKRMKNQMEKKGYELAGLNFLNTDRETGNGQQGQLILAIYYKKGNNQELSYHSLSNILKEVGFANGSKLAFICLDCCWGQILENGSFFQEVTQYFVASADEIPVFGIGYEDFCNFLLKDPDIKPHELASAMVAIYFRTNYKDYMSAPEFHNMGVSLTCVNTKKFNYLISKFSELCNLLIKNIELYANDIKLARSKCSDYTYQLKPEEYSMYNIDLIWFLENLQAFNKSASGVKDKTLDELISELIQIISLYYIKSYLGNNYEETEIGKAAIGGKGIAIMFPANIQQYKTSLYYKNRDFDSWKWNQFLQEYYRVSVAIRTNFSIADTIQERKWKLISAN